MQQESMQESQAGFNTRPPAQPDRRRDLAFAGGAVAVVMLAGIAGLFGWQTLSEKSAKATIAPAAATTTSRPQLPGPLNGVNPLPCTDNSTAPIKLKGHTLPVCPPGSQSSPAATTPAAGGR
jgi:hypothetical protein